jgi:hypothetical protein
VLPSTKKGSTKHFLRMEARLLQEYGTATSTLRSGGVWPHRRTLAPRGHGRPGRHQSHHECGKTYSGGGLHLQNVSRQIAPSLKSKRLSFKTSQKRLSNTRSQVTKRPNYKTSQMQNVPNTNIPSNKMSQATKYPKLQNIPSFKISQFQVCQVQNYLEYTKKARGHGKPSRFCKYIRFCKYHSVYFRKLQQCSVVRFVQL